MEYLTSEQDLISMIESSFLKEEKVIWSGRCIENSKRRFRIKRYSQSIIIILATILIGGFSLIAFGANMKATDPSFFYIFFGFLSVWLLIAIIATIRGIIMDMKDPGERFYVLTNKRAFSYENGKTNSLLEIKLRGAKHKMCTLNSGLGRINLIGEAHSVTAKTKSGLSFSSYTTYYNGSELEIDGIENPNEVYKIFTDAIKVCESNTADNDVMDEFCPDNSVGAPNKTRLSSSGLIPLPTENIPNKVKKAINDDEAVYYYAEAKGVVSKKSFALSLFMHLIIIGAALLIVIGLILSSNINSTNFILAIPILSVGMITLIHIVLNTVKKYGGTKRTYIITNKRVICIINGIGKTYDSLDIVPTLMKTAMNETTVFLGSEARCELFDNGRVPSKTTLRVSRYDVSYMTIFGMPDVNEPYEVLKTLLECI